MMQEYGVAAGTVERALDELRADGYLKTVLGRGLYVVPVDERTPKNT
jgi:DNA-binding GntR family transcriptional regulator